MPNNDSLTYKFAEFSLLPKERQLSRGDKSIPLTPKAFETLIAVVERVVSDDLPKLTNKFKGH